MMTIMKYASWLLRHARMVLLPANFFKSPRKRPLHPTAWLDGMRGVAALFVVFNHLGIDILFRESRRGWSSENPHFFELPIIRILYSGAAMVTIFFVVSGFALSFKPLLLAAKNEHSKLFDGVVSSIFRRGFRLFIPTVVVSFGCVWVHYFDLDRLLPGSIDPRVTTVQTTLLWWLNAVLAGLNPFRPNFSNPWDNPLADIQPVLWTIPVEYRGSIVVFVLILILAKASRPGRFGVLLIFLLWLSLVGQWDYFLFVAGMLCCELHHATYIQTNPTSKVALDSVTEATETPRQRSYPTTILTLLVFVAILYVLSQPEEYLGRGNAPFYEMLDNWTPPVWKGNQDAGRFWQCLAGVALILLVDHSAMLRCIFTSPFAQYLGEISFSMYLIHRNLLIIVALPLKTMIQNWMPTFMGNWWVGYIMSLGLIIVTSFSILFRTSELLTRYLDRPSITFASWLEVKLYEKPKKQSNAQPIKLDE